MTTNSEHIDWLLEGVETWNTKRKQSDFVPSFTGENLSVILREAGLVDEHGLVNLQGVNLAGARLVGANLEGVRLYDADLRKALLISANLNGALLEGAKLGGANLQGAQLKDTDLRNAALLGANLARTKPWIAKLFESSGQESRIRADMNQEVESIADLLNVCRQLDDHYSRDTRDPTNILHLIERKRKGSVVRDFRIYFRGDSQECPLQPSVMRVLKDEETIRRYAEADMLFDLMSRRPEEFERENFALDHLVLSRHFGLKTRLLDITRNPLVALYHACVNHETSPGRLHIFAVPSDMIKTFNSDTISIITNFAKLAPAEQKFLLGIREEDCVGPTEPIEGLEYEGVMRRLYHFIRQEKPYFEKHIDFRDLLRVFVVEPRQSFERIRAQSGAFLVSAFHHRFEASEVLRWNTDIPVYDYYPLKISVTAKDTIRKELRFLNVTSESLYPGLEASASAVNTKADERRKRR